MRSRQLFGVSDRRLMVLGWEYECVGDTETYRADGVKLVFKLDNWNDYVYRGEWHLEAYTSYLMLMLRLAEWYETVLHNEDVLK